MNLVGTVETQAEIKELERITMRFVVARRYSELGKIAKRRMKQETKQ